MKLISGLIIACFLIFSVETYGQEPEVTVKVFELDFGVYNYTKDIPTDAFTTIEITTDDTRTLVVKLGSGVNTGGVSNFHPRKMRSIDDTLEYNLYTDTARTKVWGDGSNNTYTQTGQSELKVYGRIPPKQNVNIGIYTDNVTVTIVW